MFKVGVVGNHDTVTVFKALGAGVFTPKDSEDCKNIIRQMVCDGYGVIYLTEEYAQGVQAVIKKYSKDMFPIIILIPSNTGTLGIGMKSIDENVKKAVGINLA